MHRTTPKPAEVSILNVPYLSAIRVSIIFSMFWEQPSQQMPRGNFVFFSLATILAASIIAGLILTFVSRDAAGSGIPQAKIAFWRKFKSVGLIPNWRKSS